MKLLLLCPSIAIAGLASCQLVFREGGQDTVNNDAAVGDAATRPVNVIFAVTHDRRAQRSE